MTEESQELNIPRRIICVDDFDDVRQLARSSFESSEHAKDIVVATCSSGKELMSRLRELQPNLVLLDLNMPDMNGPDTIEALRNTPDGEGISIIFLTTRTNVQMSDAYKNLGVIGIVHKPLDAETFPETIFKIWRDQGMHSEGDTGQVLTDLMEDDVDTFREEN